MLTSLSSARARCSVGSCASHPSSRRAPSCSQPSSSSRGCGTFPRSTTSTARRSAVHSQTNTETPPVMPAHADPTHHPRCQEPGAGIGRHSGSLPTSWRRSSRPRPCPDELAPRGGPPVRRYGDAYRNARTRKSPRDRNELHACSILCHVHDRWTTLPWQWTTRGQLALQGGRSSLERGRPGTERGCPNHHI